MNYSLKIIDAYERCLLIIMSVLMYKFSNYNLVCMLINRLLKLLGEEAEIDDELYEKIHDNMIERLKDKVAEIRAQAVHALQRLQDPRDDQCPIIKVSLLVQKTIMCLLSIYK